MANAKYALGTQAFVQGDIDMPSAGLWLILVGSGYTPDTGTTGDEFASDVNDQITGQALDTVAVAAQANGRVRLTAASETFAGPFGEAVTYVVLATNQGGADGTRRLLYLWDTDDDLPYADTSGTVSFPAGYVYELG
jgi:hypothetical protein